MTDDSRTITIQILLSIPLILFGLVAMYLIHRSHSQSAQTTFYDPGVTESPQDGTYEPEEAGEQSRAYVPEPASTKPRKRSLPTNPVDLSKRLVGLKYDGYMQVNDIELAWVSDEKGRIIVREGDALDDAVKVNRIHENFLLVSDADGRVTQEIPFTPGTRERDAKPLIRVGSPARNESADSSPESSALSSQFKLPSFPPPVGKLENAQRSSRTGSVVYVDQGPKTVKSVGETFTVQVRIDNGSNIFAIPFDINYDPNILEVTGLREGAYLRKGGGQTTFLNSIDKARGKITVGLTRLGRIGGVSGSGSIVSVDFKALRRGTASLSFANGKPMDAGLNALPVEFANEKIIIQ
jgi:hypothetical protein